VRAGNGTHSVDARFIVEENAAAAINLQIYEAGDQESTGGEPCPRPIAGNFAPWLNSNDAPVSNQHRGFGMPAATVKNTIRQDRMRVDN
jgi:hypothetical protein